MAIEVQVVPSLDAVPATFWSSFHCAAGVYQSRPWLEFVEWSAGRAVAYVLATEGTRAVGLLPIYPQTAAPGSGYAMTELTGACAAPETAWLCGNRRAYRNQMLLTSLPGEARREALAMLAGAARCACPGGRSTLVFPYVSTEYAEILCRSLPHAVPLLTKLDATIDIRGRSFEEYVRSLGSKKVAQVRKEMRQFEQAGYTTAIERLADCWYEAGPLVANVQRRYGHSDTPETCRRGLRCQAELLSGYDIVFTARRGGKLVASAVYYEWNGALACRVVGFDYPNLADAKEYFYLNFYRPLEYACAHGLKQILLGTGSESAKQQRGARLTGLWTVVVRPDPDSGPVDWRARNTLMQKQLTADVPVEEAELSDAWFGDDGDELW